MRSAETQSGPPGSPLLGHLGFLRRDPLGFLLDSAERFGPLVPLRIVGRRAYLVAAPELVQQVLQTDAHDYSKDNVNYRRMRPVAGDGLLTSEGELWRRQRRIVQPAFHSSQIAEFAAVVEEGTAAMLERWRGLDGAPVGLTGELARLLIEIIGRALFGIDLSQRSETIDRAFRTLNEHFGRWSIPSFLPYLPTPANRCCWAALRDLEEAATRVLTEGHGRKSEPTDLLSRLLAQESPAARAASPKECRDQVLTFLLAGYETTVSALSWTWYLLSRHREADERLAGELSRELGGGAPRGEDVKRLSFARMVLEESMRLYPPVWILSRSPIHDVSLAGRTLPARSLVFVSPFVTHRLPTVWEEPGRFDPERFSPERGAARPRFAYLPFGGGPRACIGHRFATLQALLILAAVAQRHRLELLPGQAVVPTPMLTLRPRPDLQVRIRPR